MRLGHDDETLLRAAVLADGAELVSWRVDQVHRQPGGALTVCYSTTCRRGRVQADEYLCASNAELSAMAASRTSHVILRDGEHRVAVWRRACDPELPALAAALLPDDGGSIALHAYRPLRRAVLAATDASGVRTFRKVVRPAHVSALKARHDVCSRAGLPVPRVVDYRPDGLLSLSAVAGEPMPAVLAAGGDFDMHAVIDLIERLPEPLLAQRPRPAWTSRSAMYGELACERFPELSEKIMAVATAAERGVAGAPDGPVVPTHGDLYEAQLYQQGQQITGLIDLDTAGPGHRADDLACLLGHLAALPHFDPRFRHVAGRMSAWFALADQYLGAVGLGARVAAILVTLLGTADVGGADRETQLRRAEGMLYEARLYLAA